MSSAPEDQLRYQTKRGLVRQGDDGKSNPGKHFQHDTTRPDLAISAVMQRPSGLA